MPQENSVDASEEQEVSVHRQTFGELVRFGVVGFTHNALGYLTYLLVTWLGVDPKVAVIFLYPLSTAASYFANRRWTFGHSGSMGQSMSKFVGMNVCGYFANILILYVGYDLLGFPHQLVQLSAMAFLAVVFFLVSKFFIFAGSDA